jgi:hypothetical protein
LGVLFRGIDFKRFFNDIVPILVKEKTDDDDEDDPGPTDGKAAEIDK